MWSLIKLFSMTLCVENLLLREVVGQACRFEQENGTELIIDQFGMKLPTIQDVAPSGQVLLELNTKYITNITSFVDLYSNSKEDYITPTLEKDKLMLKLTDHFRDYEKNEVFFSISISVIFKCITGDKSVIFTLPIQDTNNHAPEFSNNSYTYALPMPFPMNLSLTCFTSISARDIDLSNSRITFHLDPTDPIAGSFEVSSLPDSNIPTNYNVLLGTKNVLNFQNDVVFKLYATDSGTPPSSSEVNVTIHVNQDNSIIQFSKTLYTANLTSLTPERANGYNITFLEGDISLKGGVDENVTYDIRNNLTEYGKNFVHTVSGDRTKIQFTLKDPPKKMFLERSVLLELTATKSGYEQSTILYISLPGLSSNSAKNRPHISSNLWSFVLIILFNIIMTSRKAD